jgi:hypothetical protein
MSDWEIVNNSKPQENSSDWEKVSEPQNFMHPDKQETLGQAAIKAVPRIGEDVIRGGFNFLKNIPGYIQAAPGEISGAVRTLGTHPGHAGIQAFAGVNELINSLAQTPKNLVEYGNKRLNLLPQSAVNFINKISPEDTTQSINQLFGQPKYEGEELIRGIPRNALNIYGAGKLSSALNPMNLTAKSIAKDVVKTGELNKKRYGNLYNDLWKEAESKGYKDLSDITKGIDINTIRKYTAKKKIAGIENFLNDPSLQNAHKAKSDLLALQRDLEKQTTMREAERKQYKAVTDSINDIQSNMFKDKLGKIDPEMLNRYNTIQKGFADEVIPYRNKAINKFKRNEMSPKELVNKLSQGEFMAKRGSYHPELGLRNKILPTAATIGAGGALNMLYNNMMDDNNDH